MCIKKQGEEPRKHFLPGHFFSTYEHRTQVVNIHRISLTLATNATTDIGADRKVLIVARGGKVLLCFCVSDDSLSF